MKSTPAPVQPAGWLRKPAIPPFLPTLLASSILCTCQAASYLFINIDL